jgi:hypothetical protein
MTAERKEEARLIRPPSFRPLASVVGLNKFTMEKIDAIVGPHKG